MRKLAVLVMIAVSLAIGVATMASSSQPAPASAPKAVGGTNDGATVQAGSVIGKVRKDAKGDCVADKPIGVTGQLQAGQGKDITMHVDKDCNVIVDSVTDGSNQASTSSAGDTQSFSATPTTLALPGSN